MTLTDFLLARIAEDEAAPWHVGIDPDRVLAECEAKRRIAEAHEPVERINRHSYSCRCGCQETPERGCVCGWRECPTLRHLAVIYADHPDYRDEWKRGAGE